MEKELFYAKSFNEQMSFITAEVQRLVYRGKIPVKDYGEEGHTRLIQKLFALIKGDEKNSDRLDEICVAEKQLKAFVCGEPYAMSEEDILNNFWKGYDEKFMDELDLTLDIPITKFTDIGDRLPDDFEVCLIVEKNGRLTAGCWDTGLYARNGGKPGCFKQSRGGAIDIDSVKAWLPIEKYSIKI